VFVPTGADPGVEPTVAGDIDGGGDLGVEGRVAIPVAANHLADPNPLGIPRQCGGHGPALERGFHRRSRHRVEVIVDPNRIPRPLVGLFRHGGHRLVLRDRIGDSDQVHLPSLRYEQPEFHSH
jgi:hypothetical protein